MVVVDAWNTVGNEESGLDLIKEKISTYGADLIAQGNAKSDLNIEAIKQLKKWVDALNDVRPLKRTGLSTWKHEKEWMNSF